MDFELNEEQRGLQALCRDFARKEILPHRDEWNTTGRFPVEVFRQMAQPGLMGLLVPEEYGGAAVGAVANVAAMEEIAKADQSVAATWNAHLTIGSLPLLYFGTDEQKRRWLVPLPAASAWGPSASPSLGPGRTPGRSGPRRGGTERPGSSTGPRCSPPTPAPS